MHPLQALRAVAARPLRAARLHSAIVRAAYANEKQVGAAQGAMRQRVATGRPFAPATLRCRRSDAFPPSPLDQPPQGAADSMDFRIFFKQAKDGAVVSPWHDIPLYAGAPLSFWVLPPLLIFRPPSVPLRRLGADNAWASWLAFSTSTR